MYCLDFHLSITIIFMVYKTIDIAPCSAILTFSLDYPFFFKLTVAELNIHARKSTSWMNQIILFTCHDVKLALNVKLLADITCHEFNNRLSSMTTFYTLVNENIMVV